MKKIIKRIERYFKPVIYKDQYFSIHKIDDSTFFAVTKNKVKIDAFYEDNVLYITMSDHNNQADFKDISYFVENTDNANLCEFVISELQKNLFIYIPKEDFYTVYLKNTHCFIRDENDEHWNKTDYRMKYLPNTRILKFYMAIVFRKKQIVRNLFCFSLYNTHRKPKHTQHYYLSKNYLFYSEDMLSFCKKGDLDRILHRLTHGKLSNNTPPIDNDLFEKHVDKLIENLNLSDVLALKNQSSYCAFTKKNGIIKITYIDSIATYNDNNTTTYNSKGMVTLEYKKGEITKQVTQYSESELQQHKLDIININDNNFKKLLKSHPSESLLATVSEMGFSVDLPLSDDVADVALMYRY